MTEERREPRETVSMHGRYRSGSGMARDVVVTDISTKGCKFYDRHSNQTIGSRLTIRIGNVGPLDATVRWRIGQILGVEFDAAIHPSVLEHMVSTIPDWTLPVDTVDRTEQMPSANSSNALDIISVRIRQPTGSDFRLALTNLGMSLPLGTVAELEAVFHHVLNQIFVEQFE